MEATERNTGFVVFPGIVLFCPVGGAIVSNTRYAGVERPTCRAIRSLPLRPVNPGVSPGPWMDEIIWRKCMGIEPTYQLVTGTLVLKSRTRELCPSAT